jgi:hypothetical protein
MTRSERLRLAYRARSAIMTGPDIGKLLNECADAIEEMDGLLNEPETEDFAKGVVLEAIHQKVRWGPEHDKAHTPADWFWRLAYLSGKILHALNANDLDKARHHAITSAALLANWHVAMKD